MLSVSLLFFFISGLVQDIHVATPVTMQENKPTPSYWKQSTRHSLLFELVGNQFRYLLCSQFVVSEVFRDDILNCGDEEIL